MWFVSLTRSIKIKKDFNNKKKNIQGDELIFNQLSTDHDEDELSFIR